ncbi:hypothetical protein Vretifemale_172 [Volvox reticuliferus]|uniref:SGNH hydrolase-type esterase domain-containing protein n=1 Tax=Volvox reticuliferus TaxID=1737510 RepID=A0A8J4BUS0_9CHLO|nr:hypothetical protein Vretifemale_172 [Volvox reticuliferus]
MMHHRIFPRNICSLAGFILVLILATAKSITISRPPLLPGQHCCPVNESLFWKKKVHGLNSAASKQLEPFLSYEFLLPQLQLMAGLKYPSSAKRLRKFVSNLMTGDRPLKVGIVGGSISWGQGTTAHGVRDWFSIFMTWLASVSRVPVIGRNGCIPGTPSFYMVLCWEHSVDPDVDLILVEYVFNDGVDDRIKNNGAVRWVEQLVRRLMALPGRPAVVLVQVPHVHLTYFDPFFRTSEDLEGAVAAYYDVPTVSLRDALYPLNVHRPTEGFLWAQTYNEHHPGDAGHKALADLAVHLTQETVLGLLSYPPSRDEAEKVEGPLPPPMYSGNLPPSSSVCVVGFNFTSLVVTAEGWEWTNEGTPEKPKWGYVATEPGSQLVLQLTKRLAVEGAEALDGASTIADGSASIKGSTFPVLLHYLQSYVGMGTARVECGGECECTGVNVDALHAGRSSQTYMAAVMVTWINQTLDCELQITVLDKSRDVEGGHKFKVSGLVIAFGYDAAAVASVGKWHLPSDD